MKRIALLAFTVFYFSYSYGSSLDSLKNVLDSIARSNGVVGMEISVIKNGQITWNHQYGYRKANSKKAVDSLTLFQGASISKPITALAILKLYEQGKLQLDSNVNKYLKGWQLKNNRFTRDSIVTVRKLLNHTGGLKTWIPDGYGQEETIPTLLEILKSNSEAVNSKKIKVSYVPGEKWVYANSGWVIIQKIIEDVSGEEFKDYMYDSILKPLSMNNSTFDFLKVNDTTLNISAGHTKGGDAIKGSWRTYPESAAGGLWGTTVDLCKYIIEIQEILNGKVGGILKQETILEMLKNGKNNWGLGPYVRTEGSGMSYFGHTGWSNGYKSIFDGSFELSQGGFVIMFNTETPESVQHTMYSPIFDYYGW